MSIAALIALGFGDVGDDIAEARRVVDGLPVFLTGDQAHTLLVWGKAAANSAVSLGASAGGLFSSGTLPGQTTRVALASKLAGYPDTPGAAVWIGNSAGLKQDVIQALVEMNAVDEGAGRFAPIRNGLLTDLATNAAHVPADIVTSTANVAGQVAGSIVKPVAKAASPALWPLAIGGVALAAIAIGRRRNG